MFDDPPPPPPDDDVAPVIETKSVPVRTGKRSAAKQQLRAHTGAPRKWKKRWFSMHSEKVSFFQDEDERDAPEGTFAVQDASVVTWHRIPGRFIFAVTPKDSGYTHFLEADTARTRQQWLSAFHDHGASILQAPKAADDEELEPAGGSKGFLRLYHVANQSNEGVCVLECADLRDLVTEQLAHDKLVAESPEKEARIHNLKQEFVSATHAEESAKDKLLSTIETIGELERSNAELKASLERTQESLGSVNLKDQALVAQVEMERHKCQRAATRLRETHQSHLTALAEVTKENTELKAKLHTLESQRNILAMGRVDAAFGTRASNARGWSVVTGGGGGGVDNRPTISNVIFGNAPQPGKGLTVQTGRSRGPTLLGGGGGVTITNARALLPGNSAPVATTVATTEHRVTRGRSSVVGLPRPQQLPTGGVMTAEQQQEMNERTIAELTAVMENQRETIAELNTLSAEMENQMVILAKEKQQLNEKIKQATTASQKLDLLNSSRARTDTLQANQSKLARGKADLESMIKQAASDLAQFETQSQLKAEHLTQLINQLKIANSEAQSSKDVLESSAESIISEITQEKEELNQELTLLRRKKAVSSAPLTDADKADVDRLRKDNDSLLQQLERAKARRAELESALAVNDAAGGKTSSGGKILVGKSEWARLRQEVSEVREERTALLEEVVEQQQEQSELHSSLLSLTQQALLLEQDNATLESEIVQIAKIGKGKA